MTNQAPLLSQNTVDQDALFDTLFGTVKLGLYQADAAGKVTRPGGNGMSVSTREESAPVLWLLPEDRPRLLASWSAALGDGDQWSDELNCINAAGQYRAVQVIARPLRDEDEEEVAGFLVCATDITDQLRARDELALNEDRLRMAIEAARAGVWDLDVLENRCYFSPALLQMLGYEQNGLFSDIGYWKEIIHPDDLESAKKAKTECVEGDQDDFHLELRLKTREGKWGWFQCRGKVRRTRLGRPLRVVGTLVDISEQKKVEQMLRMEHDLMDLITTASPVGILFIEKNGNVAFVNPCAEGILGVSRHAMAATGYRIPVCHLGTVGGTSNAQDEVPLSVFLQKQGALSCACLPVLKADGSRALVTVNAAPFLDLDGETVGTVVIMEDITEQKQHEQQAADGDRLLQETQKIARLGSYVLDLAKDQWSCSSTLAEILGVDETTPMTLLGYLELIHPDCREKFLDEYLSAVMKPASFEMEYRIRRYNDGAERWVAEFSELKHDETGRLCRKVGMIHDITERKAAEEAIRNLNADLDRRVIERTSQLAAAKREIESFSYSVSHDLRAPLRHINSFCAILKEDLGSTIPEEARSYLDRIQGASSKMGKLIDDLLTLTQVGRTQMKRVRFNMSQVAAEVASMLQEGGEGSDAEFIIEDGITANGDSQLIRLVLQNLLGNALKYSSGKKARIQFGRTKIHGKTVFFVQDDGVGFDMAYADKLFQPFQRLHGAEFQGTGIGLATVKRIIERHGGSIWAHGKEMEGATFYFTLSGSQVADSSASHPRNS